jgi:metal-responsive CopG/Arc/MetJ family transcriptional regulator
MTVRVMLSLPKSFLQEVDEAAKDEYRSRSELMREALRRYLEQRRDSPDASSS